MSEHEHVRAFGGPFCAVCGVHIGFPAEPSPSRARPSDRSIARAFWHAAEFPLSGLDAAAFAAAVAVRAETIDSETPEARAGDCDAWLAEFERLLEDYVGARVETALFNVTQRSDGAIRFQRPRHQALTAYVSDRLTTKATP